MIKRRGQTLCVWFILSDAVMTGTAWIGAYFFRFYSGLIPIYKPIPEFYFCLRSLPLVLILALVAYRLAGLYEVHRLRRFREEFVGVVKGVALLSLLVMATAFYSHDPYESRATMLLFSGFCGLGVIVTRRLSWGLVHRLRRQGYNPSYALVVGTGRVARQTARALRRASWMGIRPIGHIEDNPNRFTSDLHILGTSTDLPQLVEKYRIDHVFIALPMNRYHEARRVYDILSQQLVEVRLVPDVPALSGLSLTTTNLDGLPVIGLRESPHFGLNIVVKRFMDVVFSTIGLLLLSPLMVLIAFLVKMGSPGPILYRQTRCGLNGRTFSMFKFRTMKEGAEAATGPVMTKVDDDRRTKLGTFLRRTSLDELPQLINVLLGHMSLVGPRPERPEFVQKFRKTIPNYMARHCVKAGITGWAQVHGLRGNTSLRKRIQYDLHYITHWNPWLDIRILWMTVWKVLSHRHAY